MCMFFLSVWFIGGGFPFILPFFTTGDGCNGPQATEKIQLSRGQTLPVSCATVNVKAHTEVTFQMHFSICWGFSACEYLMW